MQQNEAMRVTATSAELVAQHRAALPCSSMFRCHGGRPGTAGRELPAERAQELLACATTCSRWPTELCPMWVGPPPSGWSSSVRAMPHARALPQSGGSLAAFGT